MKLMRLKLTQWNTYAHNLISRRLRSGYKKPPKLSPQLAGKPHKSTGTHILLNPIGSVTWKGEGEFQKKKKTIKKFLAFTLHAHAFIDLLSLETA